MYINNENHIDEKVMLIIIITFVKVFTMIIMKTMSIRTAKTINMLMVLREILPIRNGQNRSSGNNSDGSEQEKNKIG